MSNIDLKQWDVEDQGFWDSTGKAIATRNLWISIPSLLVGFSVWLMWGIITVQMKNLGFTFGKSPEEAMGLLFMLPAIAGLTGATLRIPSSFFIRLAGGRNTIFFTTALLMIPAFGTAIGLQDPTTSFNYFIVMAFLSGFGGGNFASSMSNISFFYPKKEQGYALGMNAGLGNFGVTTMQILIPLVMTLPFLGALSGDSLILSSNSGTIFKRIAAGSETWLANAGWVWMLWLIPLAYFGWTRLNNIRTEAVSPNIKGPVASFGRIAFLLAIGFVTAAVGLYFILTFKALTWVKWIVLPAVIASTVFLMKAISPGEIKENLNRQFSIFDNKHTWVMTIIYTMTFGSFIGFAAAVGLAIKFIFGVKHILGADGTWQHIANPDGPATFMYVWVGAFVGALIRPIGGKMADKLGGAIITQVVSIVMVVCSVGVGYYAHLAYQSATPQEYFMPFFILIVILFAATGIGNGSTFRTISMVFNQEQAGPVLGWTSAVAAYGAFLIPKIIGENMKSGTPELAMYGFAVFYAVCAILNYWYYLGPKAEYKNP
ncbi:MAG: NarK/NasA family nitrate transporter [Candidatus Marinimicrobia bacterium]|jgi:NNP family nitrate/nitrite transporter-like MFS transporter|nr:NarK/NasA family nitrate transporter [Candidatus Neomarinimicrobiota bacterium]MBT3617294.1 NarK/NasA family nitrate transporter [Candidatus Neomarinimicrobiota bacterium]MBT3828857.1 NarK/NasA family nitrate transporter [Candidatus Neomarinimicrobiota bacterium]MBT3997828.1 NarK/NasA family nitrate transporter [Candidatus Neomarinimicrobiota bacterium]MBT4280542.1 NarK/NasA family nitrate transporter [Candidatus Neomarinimicrobiota bacterium]